MSTLKRHQAICKSGQPPSELPVPNPDVPTVRPNIKRARSETTFLKAYPVDKNDLVAYKQAMGGSAWSESTLTALCQGYGNRDAPSDIVTNVQALDACMTELKTRVGLSEATRSNYTNILKNVVLVRIWKFKLSGSAVDSVMANLGVFAKEAAFQATKASMQEISLLVFDPQGPAKMYQQLRGRWAGLFEARRSSLCDVAFDSTLQVNQTDLREAEAFIIAGLLLFHPAMRIEIFQSLVFLPGATHDEIMLQLPRSGVHQGRALVRNYFAPEHPQYPISFYIIILDDKSKEVPQKLPLVQAVSMLLFLWLICRFDRRLWGHDKSFFVFGHNSNQGIDRLLSKTVKEFLVSYLAYPADLALHKVRGMCIASVCSATNGDLVVLTNVASAMRHTLATANQYYNHWLKWTQAHAANAVFHDIFSSSEPNPSMIHFEPVQVVSPPRVTDNDLAGLNKARKSTAMVPAEPAKIITLPADATAADDSDSSENSDMDSEDESSFGDDLE